MIDLRPERGWLGAFTRDRAPGALPNGTRVVKANSETGDATPDGQPGVILGSLRAPGRAELMYFVEWANKPRAAVATIEWKVKAQEVH
jgi:hypothetical protein